MSRKKSMKDIDKSYKNQVKRGKLIRNTVCILLCLLSLCPFYIMIINATRASSDIQQGISLIPGNMFFRNISTLLKKAEGVGTPLWKSMLNSATIAVPATFLAVYFSALTAYGIFAYKFKLRRFAWSFILAVMMIPSQVTVVGFYRFMIKLRLNDSYIPLIIPALAAPATVFFMRQFMASSLPLEIVDAARIDGSGEYSTFNRIILPLLKPAIATQTIFTFIASWNNLFMPTMIISSQTKVTLPMFVQQLRSEQFRTDYGMIYVGLALTIVPLIIVYICLSRYIIAGVALGGVKE